MSVITQTKTDPSPRALYFVIIFLAILSQNSASGPINLVIPSLSIKTQSYEVKVEYTSTDSHLSTLLLWGLSQVIDVYIFFVK